jgi:hypothetical protein
LADLDPSRMAEDRGFLHMLDEQRARLGLVPPQPSQGDTC